MSDAVDDPIAELERALAALAERYRRSAPGSELRRRIDSWAESALAAVPPIAVRGADPVPAGVSEVEFERAFAAAEPELAEMITPDSVAEEAARLVDSTPDPRSPLASTGAFATRTMAELLERQGDRRGAARIRAVLGEPDAKLASARDDAAVIALLECWLANVRRLQP